MSNIILKTEKLTKVLSDKEVLKDVSIQLRKGEIYGLLGPNGAGKTTLFKLIVNLLKPTLGTVTLFGEALTEKSYQVHKRMRSIVENPSFYDHLSAKENLDIHLEYMGCYQKDEIEKVLKVVGLQGAGTKPVKKFSVGMKQRLGIARAIITKPELLILDEPINGLDPKGIREFRDLLKRLRDEEGMTIIISSHILSEIDRLADRIGILVDGELVDEATMEELHARTHEYLEIKATDLTKVLCTLDYHFKNFNYRLYQDSVRVYVDEEKTTDIISKLSAEGVVITSVMNQRSSLEDYFIKLTEEGGKHVASY